MTALELIELMADNPTDARIDFEFDHLTGPASPGDVEPELARRFVIGDQLRRALCAGPFPDEPGRSGLRPLPCILCGATILGGGGGGGGGGGERSSERLAS